MPRLVKVYNPEIKVFYGDKSADCRILPSPGISISLQFNYANDTIIGYTYLVTLNGTITALDFRNWNDGSMSGAGTEYGLGAVLDHIHKVRNILSKNGNILYVTKQVSDGGTDQSILKAKGGILRSFNINDSENNWYHNAKYTAEIEFHSIDFIGAKFSGSYSWQAAPKTEESNNQTIFLSDLAFPEGDYANFIDIKKFKIKDFNDGWSINFDTENSFNKIKNIENNNLLDIDNTSFEIQYEISATGKNFYAHTSDDTNSENLLLPAWEQAKNFVQHRLYYQVRNLINQVLENKTSTDGCTGYTKTPSTAHAIGGSEGLLKNIGNDDFMVFNEKITCSASESKGTFSATYSAIIKDKTTSEFTISETKHTISKKYNVERKADIEYKTITVDGTIEGLIEGGLIRSSKPLELPKQGSLFLYHNGADLPNKYDNAKKLLDKIYDPNQYASSSPQSRKKDFKPEFKNILNITLDALGAVAATDEDRIDAPHPVSFNITHNYDGTISYSAEYNNSSNICGRKYTEISISTNKSTPIIATFTVPNNGGCAVIQDLNTVTSKTISITIRGLDLSATGKYYITDSWINEITCIACDDIGPLPIALPNEANTILTQKQYTKDPRTGSFTVNLEYICAIGCEI